MSKVAGKKTGARRGVGSSLNPVIQLLVEINPKGGFLNYGLVRGTYALLHGSLPGPTKRLIRFRKAVRFHGSRANAVVKPEITMVSQESQQGV